MPNNVSANAACVSAEQADMLASHIALISGSEIVISPADSEAFAELSGDFNPVHIDPIVARRLVFGSTVPHGIHIILRALDATLAKTERRLRLGALRVAISGPARHNEPLTVISEQSGRDLEISVERDGERLQRIVATLLDRDTATTDIAVPSAIDWRQEPLELQFADASEPSGAVPLALDEGRFRTLFPALSKLLPDSQIAAVLATTRIVGMECPGLRSIFANLALRFESPPANTPATLAFHALRTDPRMSLIFLGLEGAGAKGELAALFRPDPVSQPSAGMIARQVRSGEFAGQRALVIGGSRGLGETTAKLVSMGGGDVAITFARGRDDAEAVAQDIVSAGGRCSVLLFDITDLPDTLAGAVLPPDFRPSHIYFFATPSIQLTRGCGFNEAKFAAYCDFYVKGLLRMMATAERLFALNESPLTLIYPSTVFIDDLPAGAAEYAAAKAAGEVVCRALARSRLGLRVACPRLPRLKTDQTSSVRPSDTADPVPVLLEVLREFR
jgi:acyl dehydratase/NAD(P)-dependent dehydrogenase (short-subunit alcohol dehydrogenase family)